MSMKFDHKTFKMKTLTFTPTTARNSNWKLMFPIWSGTVGACKERCSHRQKIHLANSVRCVPWIQADLVCMPKNNSLWIHVHGVRLANSLHTRAVGQASIKCHKKIRKPILRSSVYPLQNTCHKPKIFNNELVCIHRNLLSRFVESLWTKEEKMHFQHIVNWHRFENRFPMDMVSE